MNPKPDETRSWCPRTNMFVSDTGELIIRYELSSMRSADLEITVDQNGLRVTGVRHDPEIGKSRQQLVKEYPVGPFERNVSVPDGFDVPASKAAYLNGILTIIIPRKDGPSEFVPHKVDPPKLFVPPARLKLG